MHETHVTVVGNVATDVNCVISANGHPLARFRLASTVRRFDAQRETWTDTSTSFYTVWAWRTLATNLASSVVVGQPLIVQGQLRIKEGERDGRRFVAADLIASSAGHDLSRGTAAFVRGGAARRAPAAVVAGEPAGVPGTPPVLDPAGSSGTPARETSASGDTAGDTGTPAWDGQRPP